MSYLSTAPAGGAGSGTVTQVNSGVGLTGGPITTVGTLDFATSLQPMATLTGNALKVLRVNAAETAVEYATGASSPAGSDTQVQFNDSGVMAGSANLVFNKTTPYLRIGGTFVNENGTLRVNGSVFAAGGFSIPGLTTLSLASLYAAASFDLRGYDGTVQKPILQFTNTGTPNLAGNFNTWVGINSPLPTHSLTLGSTSTGIALYNTVDQVTNFERGLLEWNSNELNLRTISGGTGTNRALRLGSRNASGNQTSIYVTRSGAPFIQFEHDSTSTTGKIYRFTGSSAISSGSYTCLAIEPTIAHTGTGAYTGVLVNVTETTPGTGSKLLADFQVGGTSRFSIDNNGATTITRTITGAYTALTLTNSSTSIGDNVVISMRPANLSTGRAQIHAIAPGSSDAELAFFTSDNNAAPTEKVRINAIGNLGVRTISPASIIHAYQDDAEVGGGGGITIEQDGTGDALLQFLLSGTKRWVTGIDNSDNDDFKFSPVADLSNGVVRISTAGKITANGGIGVRAGTTTSSATPTINTDTVDFYSLTAQAVDITSFTTNLSGTPTDGQKLWIAITGTAARAITWGASFEASTVALPTTTVSTNRLDVGFVWNAATSKWRCVAAG